MIFGFPLCPVTVVYPGPLGPGDNTAQNILDSVLSLESK